jgi:glycosyltransferase involved in cell wall biosynthesis
MHHFHAIISTMPNYDSNYSLHISLVCTVRDEADNIADLLDSMLAQTRRPDEIVVNDCASCDATPTIVERYIAAGHPIRLVRGGNNIPSGRNNAIRHARYELIACTDAGLVLAPDWLERITAPLVRGEADVVGGFFRPLPRSLFELSLSATNYPDADEVQPERFLPFGQSVAFCKAAWACVGGYPEWASHCEDLVFDLALKRAGFRFAFVPDALVLFRPRESLRAFARQYYLYARGDGVAGLWPRRYAIRYGVYAVGLLLILAVLRRPQILGLLLIGGLAYCAQPLRRLLRRAPALDPLQTIRAAALIPLIRLVGDSAKMIGYPVGRLRRRRSTELQEQIRVYGRTEEQRIEEPRTEKSRTGEPGSKAKEQTA